MSQVGASWEDVGHQIVSIVSGCDYDPRRDMHFIDPKSINSSNWLQSRLGAEQYWMTDNVSSICPHCNQKVVIQLQTFRPIGDIQSLASKGMCPQCREAKPIRVFFIGVKPKGSQTRHCDQIWIDPAPTVRAMIIDELNNNDIEKRIYKAYKNAINAFNIGSYELCLISCGRVVEGIGKTAFPNAEKTNMIGPLFKKLKQEVQEKPEAKKVLQPFIDLGNALRLGRNPGGHFDLVGDPNKALADKVLDLTEFLIKYIYVIGNESKNVEKLILELRPADKDEENEEET